MKTHMAEEFLWKMSFSQLQLERMTTMTDTFVVLICFSVVCNVWGNEPKQRFLHLPFIAYWFPHQSKRNNCMEILSRHQKPKPKDTYSTIIFSQHYGLRQYRSLRALHIITEPGRISHFTFARAGDNRLLLVSHFV